MIDTELPAPRARAGRSATLLLVAYVVLFLTFAAGGIVTMWTFWQNSNTSFNCFGGQYGACGVHHSYVLGITLIAVGFVGLLVTMAVGARVAVGYGLGAIARFQQRQR